VRAGRRPPLVPRSENTTALLGFFFRGLRVGQAGCEVEFACLCAEDLSSEIAAYTRRVIRRESDNPQIRVRQGSVRWMLPCRFRSEIARSPSTASGQIRSALPVML
jgi:hypothetical protein